MTKTEALNKAAQEAGYRNWYDVETNPKYGGSSIRAVAIAAMDIYAGGWISVEERLPEVGEAVLILTYYGKLDVCRLSHSGDIWLNDLRPQHSNGGVTHWQPLPTAP